MRKAKNAGPATAVAEPEPALESRRPRGSDPLRRSIPAAEKDYWHVNYMTRPYYKEGRSFGDYEAAYRFGWENAAKAGEVTFEEAEKAHLAGGWTAARGESPLSWEEVREATRDAWTRARRKPAVSGSRPLLGTRRPRCHEGACALRLRDAAGRSRPPSPSTDLQEGLHDLRVEVGARTGSRCGPAPSPRASRRGTAGPSGGRPRRPRPRTRGPHAGSACPCGRAG